MDNLQEWVKWCDKILDLLIHEEAYNVYSNIVNLRSNILEQIEDNNNSNMQLQFLNSIINSALDNHNEKLFMKATEQRKKLMVINK